MHTYSIVRIAGLHYPEALRAACACCQGQRTYAEQQRALFQQGFVYSDSFSKGMRVLGHVAQELVYDCAPMQKRWAEERGARYRSTHWQTDILLQQIAALRPDIIYFQDIHALPFAIRRELKTRFPFLQLIVIYRGFPGVFPSLMEELATADVLLLGSPTLRDSCLRAGLRPHLVYHSFDPGVLAQLGSVPLLHACTFVGSSGFGHGSSHVTRYRLLEALLRRTPLQAWVEESMPRKGLRKCAEAVLSRIPGGRLAAWAGRAPARWRKLIEEVIEGIPQRPLRRLFPERCHPPLFGIEMYRTLAASKVTLNKHAVPAEGFVDNIRLFQATGVGACLLTDGGANLSDLFEADREVVTYASLEECLEKVRYLLTHDAVRTDIARRGQQRTLREHTTLHRCQQIETLLREAMP
jgi:hypothetical protein